MKISICDHIILTCISGMIGSKIWSSFLKLIYIKKYNSIPVQFAGVSLNTGFIIGIITYHYYYIKV